MQPVVRAASRLTLAVGVPLAAGGMLLAEPLMGFAWGEEFRTASAAPFAILVWSVATVFANVPYATILLATGRETRYLRAVGAGAALNVLANFVLIPRFGLTGAAAATMASEVVVLSLYILETRSIVHHEPARDLWRPLLAAALMAAVVLRLVAHPGVAGAAGAVVYGVVCLALGQVGRADLAVLRRRPPASGEENHC